MEPLAAPEGDITLLLRKWSEGHDEAFGQLLPLAYGRLRTIAGAYMRRQRQGHTLQATALVGELYLKLAGKSHADWRDREHFFRFCANAMRSILTDHARSSLREKRRLDMQIPLTEEMPWLGSRESDITDLDMALWKLEALDPRKSKVLELRIYLGATAAEAGQIMGLSKATVDRDLTLARAWLFRELRPEEKHGKEFHESTDPGE
jgi:RNA polymerase sigma factor (TIGR02999 family)